jgi:D-alanyl-D-alanine carboxypeptidase
MPASLPGRRASTLVIALLTAALAGCAASPAPSPSASASSSPTALAQAPALQGALEQFHADAGDAVPGVIARVITPDGTWTGTAGSASPDSDEAITADTRTRIGSITKTMTATLLLQLVQDGDVSLDDRVGDYIPDTVNPDATLRQVADMTSGIPSYSLSPQWQQEALSHPERTWTPQELLDTANSLPASFAPGAGWEYSNTNYVLLGLIIEQITQQPIADVFQERLFEPLGMTESEFAEDASLPAPHLEGITAQGQPAGETANATAWSPTITFTAGQVVSTVDDLERWAHALFTGDGVLDRETQQLRRDSILTSPPPNTESSGYGIGWGNRDGWWGHTGEIPGFNSAVYHDYDTDTTILILVNSDVPLASGDNPAPAALAALQSALG